MCVCVKTSLLRVDRPLLCFNTSLLIISPAQADMLPAANCTLIVSFVCVKTSLLRVNRPLLCVNTSLLRISPAKADMLPASFLEFQ